MKSGTGVTGLPSMKLHAPDYVNHDPYNPDQGTGPEGFKQRVGGYRSVLHDFDLRIERQIGEGDWVETHWSLRGNHGGELEGTAPTGKSVYVDGQLLSHIVDGKFVEERVHWNTLGLLRQIGGSPAPQGVTARAAPACQELGRSPTRMGHWWARSGHESPGVPLEGHGFACWLGI